MAERAENSDRDYTFKQEGERAPFFKIMEPRIKRKPAPYVPTKADLEEAAKKEHVKKIFAEHEASTRSASASSARSQRALRSLRTSISSAREITSTFDKKVK